MYSELKRRLEKLETLLGMNPMFPSPPSIEIVFVTDRNPNAPPRHDDSEGPGSLER